MPPHYTPTISPVKITEFARDMAIYGSDDLEAVVSAHGLTPQQALELSETSVYMTEFSRVEAQLSDPHAALRIKAQNMLPTHVDIIGQIAADKFQPGTTRLKAIEMASKLAGVGEEPKQHGGGVIVNLSFGGLVATPAQLLPAIVEVEDTRPTLDWDIDA